MSNVCDLAIMIEIWGCGAPEKPLRAVVSVTGMIAKYSCEDGFVLEGNSNIECTEKGWSERVPLCVGMVLDGHFTFINCF